MRGRQPSQTRQARVLTLALVFVLHALFTLVLWHEMQPKLPQLAATPDHGDRVLVVSLLDHPSTPHAAQPPAPPTPPALAAPQQVTPPRIRPVTQEKSRHDAIVMQDHAAPPAPAVSVATPTPTSLFAKDGSVRLPPTTAAAPATTSTEAKPTKPADDRQIMQHDSNHLNYKPTRFDKYFPPPNETAGGAVGRHVGDAIQSIAKSICDPKRHGFNPLCGSPPIPPSPKDGDARLSLPPAPLASDPNAPAAPPLSTCIAEYNATKPLSYGCPANTPDLAFKAEMRECIDLFRAGKRLKTWCPVDTPKRAAAESATPAASSSAGSH